VGSTVNLNLVLSDGDIPFACTDASFVAIIGRFRSLPIGEPCRRKTRSAGQPVRPSPASPPKWWYFEPGGQAQPSLPRFRTGRSSFNLHGQQVLSSVAPRMTEPPSSGRRQQPMSKSRPNYCRFHFLRVGPYPQTSSVTAEPLERFWLSCEPRS
jgi:hypothetical protein